MKDNRNGNRTSFTLKIAQAIMRNDDREIGELYQAALEEMSGACCKVIGQYHHSDLPLVVAAMLMVANGMKSTLPESGQGIVNTLLANTSCIAVDLSTLRQQFGGENGDGGEKKF